MADVSADKFLSATKCVLEHIDKFREITAGCHFELLKGKDVLVSQPMAPGKFIIFSPSQSCASSMR